MPKTQPLLLLRHDDDVEDATRQPFIRGPSEEHGSHHRRGGPGACAIAVVALFVGAAIGAALAPPTARAPPALASTTTTTTTPTNPPNIPPECVTALGGGVMGPGGSIRMDAGRNDTTPASSSGSGCRSALAAYAAQPDGPYYRDVAFAVQQAYGALGIVEDEERRLMVDARSHRQRGVVVFDIDETALSNAPLSSSPSLSPLLTETGARRVARADAPALESTLRLYRALQRQGLAAAFVTGRGEASRAETERNLRAAGYGGRCSDARGGGGGGRGGGEGGDRSSSISISNSSSSSKNTPDYCYLSLTLRAPGDARPASVYKPEARAAVAAASGLPVVGSVGDQWSDLSGEGMVAVDAAASSSSSPSPYVAIKLPNPFYYIL